MYYVLEIKVGDLITIRPSGGDYCHTIRMDWSTIHLSTPWATHRTAEFYNVSRNTKCGDVFHVYDR